jgi:hypothetical protein
MAIGLGLFFLTFVGGVCVMVALYSHNFLGRLSILPREGEESCENKTVNF